MKCYLLKLYCFNTYLGSDGFTEPAFPVLIFIHGDSYEYGSGNGYDFSLFSSLGGAIVVTLNYRLGLLGKLSLIMITP